VSSQSKASVPDLEETFEKKIHAQSGAKGLAVAPNARCAKYVSFVQGAMGELELTEAHSPDSSTSMTAWRLATLAYVIAVVNTCGLE
jgi:hypothetical protein